MAYNLTKKVPYSFEETLEKTKSALADEGLELFPKLIRLFFAFLRLA